MLNGVALPRRFSSIWAISHCVQPVCSSPFQNTKHMEEYPDSWRLGYIFRRILRLLLYARCVIPEFCEGELAIVRVLLGIWGLGGCVHRQDLQTKQNAQTNRVDEDPLERGSVDEWDDWWTGYEWEGEWDDTPAQAQSENI